MHDHCMLPKPNIYWMNIHEIAYLPQRFRTAFLQLIVRAGSLDEGTLNLLVEFLAGHALARSIDEHDVKEIAEMELDAMGTAELEALRNDPWMFLVKRRELANATRLRGNIVEPRSANDNTPSR